jgi:hypothetical protein
MSPREEDNQAMALARGGEISQSFAEMTVRGQAETASTAVAAREQAALQARYIMAMRQPRDVERFRSRLLADCQRYTFAEVAKYCRPVGGGKNAEGPSIRFAEAALRAYGNASAEVSTVFDNDKLRILRVVVIDYETNTGYATDIPVAKAIEKRGERDGKPPKGRVVISQRINSYGDPTFLVEATEDELLVRQAALVSKSIRTQALRILPGDIVEEAMAQVERTLEAGPKNVDPKAAMRAMIDAFATIGVTVEDLRQWSGGRELLALSPKELSTLRKAYAAIKEGHATWADFMEAQDPSGTAEDAEKVKNDKLAALRTATPEKTAAPVTGTGPDAPQGDKRFITADQAQEFAQVIHDNHLDDEQIAKLVKAGGADRYDQMQPNLFEVVLKMAKATKGKAAKK